ncbi:MAG: helix-turn-helix transcriptional regulator [Acetobacteraceae bacterium]
MPDTTIELLDQRRVATILHVTGRCLERWRAAGFGPPFLKLGKRTLYSARDIEAWLRSRTFHSTSEADAAK